jgi:predicted transcriptional regulator
MHIHNNRTGDRLGMVANLLDAINRNPDHAPTRQLQASTSSFVVAKAMAEKVVSKGFLRKTPFRERENYHITNSGVNLLRQINWCYDVLADKQVVERMVFA